MDMKTPQDWIERLRNKEYAIRDNHRDDLAVLIEMLVADKGRRGKLLVDIFNSDESPALGAELLNRIDGEVMGAKPALDIDPV